MVLEKLSEDDLNRPPEDVYDVLHQIGRGSYGSVYKCIHKESRQVFAIKKVPVDNDLPDMIKEISIMEQCNSPFVVKYIGSYITTTDLWIVMEFCGGGSVLDIMKLRGKSGSLGKRQVKTFGEKEIAKILHDTLKGLEYLHLRKKIHRDIKAGNILLNLEGNAKLADFGVAAQLTNTIAKRNTLIGTPFWMAPEVIQDIGYDCVADIWSLGITALEMAEGKVPYIEIHPMRAMFMIPSKPPPSFSEPDKWSSEFIDFVSRCLVKNPNNRATASELLNHEFAQDIDKSSNILVTVIAEAQQIRESLPEICSNDDEPISEELDSTLVEQTEMPTTTVNSLIQRFESDCGTMIQHSTITDAEGSIDGMPPPYKPIDDLEDISSNLETMVTNEDKTKNKENIQRRNELYPHAPGPSKNHHTNHSAILNNSTKENVPASTSKPSSTLSDIEIAEQLYMNANITRQNKPSIHAVSTSGLDEEVKYQNTPHEKVFSKDPTKAFAFLKSFSTEELKSKLKNLDHEMESEIEQITRRYHEKRQPILEGINEKRKHQHNF